MYMQKMAGLYNPAIFTSSSGKVCVWKSINILFFSRLLFYYNKNVPVSIWHHGAPRWVSVYGSAVYYTRNGNSGQTPFTSTALLCQSSRFRSSI